MELCDSLISPPPTQRNLSRHPSKTSLMQAAATGMSSVGASSRMNQHGLPPRQHAAAAAMGSGRVARQQATPHGYHPVSTCYYHCQSLKSTYLKSRPLLD